MNAESRPFGAFTHSKKKDGGHLIEVGGLAWTATHCTLSAGEEWLNVTTCFVAVDRKKSNSYHACYADHLVRVERKGFQRQVCPVSNHCEYSGG
jgi:hypothetical protein